MEAHISKQFVDKIVSLTQLNDDIFKLTLESEYISANAKAGQFVNIKCCEGTQALLRRPISICSVDREKGRYDLLFQKKGTGTELLADKKAGDVLNVLGPLGNSFDLNIKYRRIAVVGGGIGIFPLLFILNESKAIVKRAYLGFRTSSLVVLEEEFQKTTNSLVISTDDGSYGTGGFVTDILKRDIEAAQFDIIYTCGPLPMLKQVVNIAKENGIACQVSMEQRMGCGFGACLVCACKTHAGNSDGTVDEGWQYSHVCKDGPVFNGKDIIWEEL